MNTEKRKERNIFLELLIKNMRIKNFLSLFSMEDLCKFHFSNFKVFRGYIVLKNVRRGRFGLLMYLEEFEIHD